jgi:hypothetical protein
VKPEQPPRLGMLVLRRLGPQNDALAGDLAEEYRAGRAAAWYSCQVLARSWWVRHESCGHMGGWAFMSSPRMWASRRFWATCGGSSGSECRVACSNESLGPASISSGRVRSTIDSEYPGFDSHRSANSQVG